MSIERTGRFAPTAWLVAMHAALFAVLAVFARGAIWCCDADYYLKTADLLFAHGLGYDDYYAGYRSYFVPLVVGAIDRGLGFAGETYALRAALAYTAISFATSVFVVRCAGLAAYVRTALPLVFNPFLAVPVLYPMQEGVLLMLGLPLLVWGFAAADRSPSRTLVTIVGFTALAFVVRSSLAWLVVPAVVAIGVDVWRRRSAWAQLGVARAAAISLAIPLVLIAPQMWIAKQKFDTYYPYPGRLDLASKQVLWGIEMWKYATVRAPGGEWQGLRYATPFVSRAEEDKTVDFYLREPAAGVALVLAHAWTGLHYEQPKPYFKQSKLGGLSPWLAASAAIVALGLAGLARRMRERIDPAVTTWLAATFVLSCGYTAFVAAEARFGLLGFAALSMCAATRAGQKTPAETWVLVGCYVAACVLINTLLLSTTGLAISR